MCAIFCLWFSFQMSQTFIRRKSFDTDTDANQLILRYQSAVLDLVWKQTNCTLIDEFTKHKRLSYLRKSQTVHVATGQCNAWVLEMLCFERKKNYLFVWWFQSEAHWRKRFHRKLITDLLAPTIQRSQRYTQCFEIIIKRWFPRFFQ